MMGPAIRGIIFLLISLAMMLGVTASWVVFLVAVWRGMKAHESVAQSLKVMAKTGCQPPQK